VVNLYILQQQELYCIKKIDFIDLEIRFKGNPFNSPQIQTTMCNFEVLSS
jgi:hypothetical protein